MKKQAPTAEQLLANIKRYPGYTLAEHAADFGVSAADLVAQRLKLARSGAIKSKGATRAATWTAVPRRARKARRKRRTARSY